MPKLYFEEKLSQTDKALRSRLYNGFFGSHYQYLYPLLTLPARPFRTSRKSWMVYIGATGILVFIVGYLVTFILTTRSLRQVRATDVFIMLLAALVAYIFSKHLYLLNLLVLAVPVKLSLSQNKFRPAISFVDLHANVIAPFLGRQEKLQILDVSTGTCNSLYRHGWMQLNAEYTGLDLSETMLLQGMEFMSRRGVAMDFVLGDAVSLPFSDEAFDIVLNYGAMNALGDPGGALSEMARVAKSGGLVLFLDEQLYEGASLVEKLYFRSVLASHGVLDRCPVELTPPTLEDVEVHQVYQFYYVCTSYKKPAPKSA